ncbi:TIR domain-containing protein [Mesorhizobium sp. B1-1-5]|uniref:TIR domain-containing protein n=1 Tax=Mesorhizobium sp. B1-1-5 TaxID=2589979 RepID=UPI0015E3334E|nr:TIR domain-containing protein [Mesorhizobium sp. B1-1-5]
MGVLTKRFDGIDGMRRMADVIARSTIGGGDETLAQAIVEAGTVIPLISGEAIIRAGGDDTDIYFIISGLVGIDVKGVRVNHRRAGDHVGEISAADPSQPRSADVVVVEDGVALRVPEGRIHELAKAKPEVWRRLLVEANKRLVQRNALVRPANEQPVIFIISSVEALETARAIQLALSHDSMLTTVWTDGVFRTSVYPVDSLAAAVEASDFAIAVLHGDDLVATRGTDALVPRDNVTFELGLFMGNLGRQRSILVEPRDGHVKLASDLRGLTTLSYRATGPGSIDSRIGPTVTEIRRHIAEVGVRR